MECGGAPTVIDVEGGTVAPPRALATRYRDRREAGVLLAESLADLAREQPIVLGLPRGGVVVAAEVARTLGAPLDVVVVRKLGVPSYPELAFGAVGEGGVMVIDDAVCRDFRIGEEERRSVAARELREVDRRAGDYRGEREPPDVRGRTVIIVDDGLATGATASAAVRVMRKAGAGRVVIAVPVGSARAVDVLRTRADDVVCLAAPRGFRSVGENYDDFSQETDESVRGILQHDPVADVAIPIVNGSTVTRHQTRLSLPGRLSVPTDADGLVVFAHGSGSSRMSSRNVRVAAMLHRARLATLLFDLLTAEEDGRRDLVFDVEFLAGRVVEALDWCAAHPRLEDLPVGLFGASTGAAAALVAAAQRPDAVHAVVSRGGRVDLADPWLSRVAAPTLLIVGGHDVEVLRLNRWAQQSLRCESRLDVIPGAGHLFEEPGALDRVSTLAGTWFLEHLGPARSRMTVH